MLKESHHCFENRKYLMINHGFRFFLYICYCTQESFKYFQNFDLEEEKVETFEKVFITNIENPILITDLICLGIYPKQISKLGYGLISNSKIFIKYYS